MRMMASGEEIIAISPEDFEVLAAAKGSSARSLKEHLGELTGHPRFRQRLLSKGCLLRDDVELHLPMSLDLVLLEYSTPLQTTLSNFWAAVQSDKVKDVEAFLQHPHDANHVLAHGMTGLCEAARRLGCSRSLFLAESPKLPCKNACTK